VPGAMSFQGLDLLIVGDVVGGVGQVVEVMTVAMALATGLVAGNGMVPAARIEGTAGR